MAAVKQIELHTHEEVGVVTFITCCSCNLFLQEYSHAKTTHPTLGTHVVHYRNKFTRVKCGF